MQVDDPESTIQKGSDSLLKVKLLRFGLMNDLLTGRVRVPEGIAVAG